MDFLEKMNAALDHIESHLEGEIDYRALAHLAGCSEYHLSRMFPFLTGQGLGQYIRLRRLSQAALVLQDSQADLLEVAVRFGYSSVDAFGRAFREVHGLSPSQAALEGARLRVVPRLRFQMHIQGGTEMVYRIVQKPEFHVVGIKKTVPLVFAGPNPDIDALWKTLTPESIARWKALPPMEPKGIISASTNFSEGRMEEKGTLDYYIGVATPDAQPQEAADLTVAAGAWAVFEAVGNFPVTLQNLWGRVYSEWFPSVPYQGRPGPEILWNEGPDTSKPDFRSELWIPIVSK